VAVKYQILCVKKSDRFNPHERITHVGGRNAGGASWLITQQDAIQGIENGKWQFYVIRGYDSVDVVVATSRYGYKYLKTVADGEQPNNLLSLPECR